MALQLTNGDIFLHCPRTGGTYVTAVLRKLGLVAGGIGNKHDCPGVVPINMIARHYVFIRHPLPWIRSVWSWQVAHDWPTWPKSVPGRWWHPFRELNDTPPDARDDFGYFIEWVARSIPGFASRTFVKFADWPCSHVLCTDRMSTDLPDMLAQLGVEHDRARNAMTACMGSRNASEVKIAEPSQYQLAFFLETERLSITRWNLNAST